MSYNLQQVDHANQIIFVIHHWKLHWFANRFHSGEMDNRVDFVLKNVQKKLNFKIRFQVYAAISHYDFLNWVVCG